MTLEDFSRRLGGVLAICSAGVFVVALVCALGGDNEVPAVNSLHHLFGLAFAVLGVVLLAVGFALTSLVPPDSAGPPVRDHDPEGE